MVSESLYIMDSSGCFFVSVQFSKDPLLENMWTHITKFAKDDPDVLSLSYSSQIEKVNANIYTLFWHSAKVCLCIHIRIYIHTFYIYLYTHIYIYVRMYVFTHTHTKLKDTHVTSISMSGF